MQTPQQDVQKVRVKIKPKIVHQHTYLSGQTFYGVIRPKEEVEAMERHRAEQHAAVEAKEAAQRVTAARSKKRAAPKRTTRAIARRTTHKRVVRKTLKPRSSSRSASRTMRKATPTRKIAKKSAKKARR